MEMQMKTLIFVLAVAMTLPAMARGGHGGKAATGTGAKASSTHVSGYTKSNGTYVAPARRSTADETKSNNWTTKGNRNPVTGKAGTK